MLGKRLYKTHMLNLFRVIVLAVVVFFINDFYLETITSSEFQTMNTSPFTSSFQKWVAFFKFHYHNPADIISLFLIVIVPAVYFAFIRGVRFHEKGFVFNRGIPFVNHTILYEDVKSYKLLHPKHAIWLTTKTGDAFIVADNNVERVIAILDQHDVPGDLAQDTYVRMITNYKQFMIICVAAVVIVFVLRKIISFINL